MDRPKAKTNNERQKSSDDRHRALGRKGRKVWATPDEHADINELLVKLRSWADGL